MKRTLLVVSTIILAGMLCHAQKGPDAEYLYATRDTSSLMMSVYESATGSTGKPTVLFCFGGGFVSGSRDARTYRRWFEKLNADGYKVISIDYRLALKGKKVSGTKGAALIYDAVETGVEDLFTATAFIVENSEALGVDPSSIVIAGSSAGAMIALQAEWHLCNRSGTASLLPEDFRFAGVMSFAGAVFSREGKPSFAREPAPVLFLHGTDDKVVNYGRKRAGKLWFGGAGALADIFAKAAYSYNIYRFTGNRHEIASAFLSTYNEQLRFLESNVEAKQKRIVDASVSDPSIKVSQFSLKDLYN